jgi:hypothetical protein
MGGQAICIGWSVFAGWGCGGLR